MKTRIISGIMVVVIMLALVWAGGVVLTAGLCLISSIGFLEMTKALGIRDKSDKIHILEIIGVIANVFYYALIYLRASYGYLMLYVMLTLHDDHCFYVPGEQFKAGDQWVFFICLCCGNAFFCSHDKTCYGRRGRLLHQRLLCGMDDFHIGMGIRYLCLFYGRFSRTP